MCWSIEFFPTLSEIIMCFSSWQWFGMLTVVMSVNLILIIKLLL